jgi:hypothetical protein
MLKKQIRIAVCFSSEVRTFNEGNAESWRQFVYDLKQLESCIDVDFYGHTWDDNEIPRGLDFKSIQIDPVKEVINDWVLGKPFLRGYLTREDIHSPLNFDNIFNSTKHAIGQHVSGLKSLLIPDKTYDLYIKARWDSYLTPDVHEETSIAKLENGINKFLSRDHQPAVFYPVNQFGVMNDVIMIFNNKFVTLLHEKGVDYFMELLERNNGMIQRMSPSFQSHSNWEYILTPNHYPELARDTYPTKDVFYLEKIRRPNER